LRKELAFRLYLERLAGSSGWISRTPRVLACGVSCIARCDDTGPSESAFPDCVSVRSGERGGGGVEKRSSVTHSNNRDRGYPRFGGGCSAPRGTAGPAFAS
ncbi:hypothetical protein KI387_021439, partial [Taxus chinensis]